MNPPRVIDRSKQKTLSGYHLTDDDDDSSYNSIREILNNRANRNRKEKKKENPLVSFSHFTRLRVPAKREKRALDPPLHTTSFDTRSRTTSSSLLIHQLAISRLEDTESGNALTAECNSNAVSVPVHREGRCRGVEQRSLLIAILEHGRPEMEKSCREWTGLLVCSRRRPVSAPGIRVPGSSTGSSSCKTRFRGSRPRKPPINRSFARPPRWNSSANEFVGNAG